jgi:coenzyme PQQ precursor peptide PqqA
MNEGVVGPMGPITYFSLWRLRMTWTKPEAEIVAVTMEVTAYVATL